MKPRKPAAAGEVPADPARLAATHLRVGWWALLLFLSLGLVLESLHGFKLQWYVSVGTETRRELWRLAHAHGTMLALVNVAFALTVRALGVAP